MSPGPSRTSSSTASTIASVWSRTTRLALLVVVRLLDQRPVADLDGVGAPGHLDDRRGSPSAKCAANRSGSMVAEVITTLRSGRRGSSCLR